MIKTSEVIPYEHVNKWYEVFKCSSGRFNCEPLKMKNGLSVIYTFDSVKDLNSFNATIKTITTPIVETRRTYMTKLINRLKKLFKLV